jgi:hypothetical protein
MFFCLAGRRAAITRKLGLGVTNMSGLVHPAKTFSTQLRTACAGQLIDGEVVARAEPAIADGEPGSRGRGPPGNGKR